ncbi:MAG TPA: MerR family transcriptional regulator [Kineosporiaceae bacterium]|nr:MerR family transcriptional regulator [Kineosporiaceae bacterium]
MYTVGELATVTGVPATALRYYDDLGLVVAERLPNGHRRYPEAALDRVRLVRQCQHLGLSLEEIATAFRAGGGDRRRDLARRKLAELDALLGEMQQVRGVLAHLVECEHLDDESEQCLSVVRSAMTPTA